MVARAQVLHRAATIWPTGGVPYSMVTIHQPDGYRQDCSGFASLCWAIPSGRDGGKNTASLVTEGWMYEISAAQLAPGDAIGLCGPGTLGAAGHIQIFEGWTATGLIIWEQAGGTVGPRRRTIKSITPGYRAYRYAGITDGGGGDSTEDDDMGASFGPIDILRDVTSLCIPPVERGAADPRPAWFNVCNDTFGKDYMLRVFTSVGDGTWQPLTDTGVMIVKSGERVSVQLRPGVAALTIQRQAESSGEIYEGPLTCCIERGAVIR